MIGKLEDFIKSDDILSEIDSAENKKIMVIGGPDTGKTVLVEHLAVRFAGRYSTGVADLDMGQSHIGLPTTVGWCRVGGAFEGWEGLEPDDFYFVGSTSPPGNLLATLTGARYICDIAESACQKVVIDTTGLIAEPTGRVLKQYKFELLRPDIVLALERKVELSYILGPFSRGKDIKLYRLGIPPGATLKNTIKRANYRREAFKRYFAGADECEVDLKKVGLRGSGDAARLNALDLAGKVLSFRNAENNDLALGLIERVNLKDNKLYVKTPLKKDAEVISVILGNMDISLK